MANYAINRAAVSEVEGVDIAEVVAAIRTADPEATPEEVMAEAADQAEAIYAAQREERSEGREGDSPASPAPEGEAA